MSDVGKTITNALEMHVGSLAINGESEVWDDPDGGVIRLANAIKHVVQTCEKDAWTLQMPGGRKSMVEVDTLLAAVTSALGVREDPKET